MCKQSLRDNSSDLSSDLWREVMEIFKIKHSFSTIYHPETQGTLEKFHHILKNMIKPLVENYPNNWDFAYHLCYGATENVR